MAIGCADVFSRMRGGHRTWVGRSGLAGEIARRPIRVVNTQRAVVEQIRDKWKWVRVRLIGSTLFPGRHDDTEILVLENDFVHVGVGLLSRSRVLGSGCGHDRKSGDCTQS